MAVVTQTGNKAANMMEFMAGQSEVNVKPASPSGGPMFRWYLIVMENQKGERSRGGTHGKASTVSQFVRLITWKAKAALQPLVMCCKVPHFTWWFNAPHCILEFDKKLISPCLYLTIYYNSTLKQNRSSFSDVCLTVTLPLKEKFYFCSVEIAFISYYSKKEVYLN